MAFYCKGAMSCPLVMNAAGQSVMATWHIAILVLVGSCPGVSPCAK